MLFDSLDRRILLMAFYLMFALTLFFAAKVLKKFRGNSLLGIAVICLSTQVATNFIALPAYAAENRGLVSEPAFTRLGVAMIIFFLVSTAALIFYHYYFPAEIQQQYSSPVFSPFVIAAVLFIGAVFLMYRIKSGAGQLVLTQGTDALGGSAYYNLRSELIWVHMESYSRFKSHFEHFSRKILLLLLITASFFVARYRTFKYAALVAGFFTILLVDEFIRFQKGPIVFLAAAAILPFILFRWHDKSGLSFRRILRLGAAVAILFLISGLVVAVTMGLPGSEVVRLVWERFFVVPSFVSSMYFQVYPEMNPFVLFTNLRLIATATGLGPLTYTGSIPLDVAEALTGGQFSANACLVADGWANAGYLGVIFVSLLMCGTMICIDRYVSRARRSVDITPLLLFYWLCVLSFGNQSLINALIANALWLLPFLYPYIIKQSASAAQSLPNVNSDKLGVSGNPDGIPLATRQHLSFGSSFSK